MNTVCDVRGCYGKSLDTACDHTLTASARGRKAWDRVPAGLAQAWRRADRRHPDADGKGWKFEGWPTSAA
jgi:hypothetical protein